MKRFKQVLKYGATTIGAVVVSVAPAFAVSLVDYANIATALTAEITEAIPAFVAVMGVVIGVPLALRLIKRIVR